MPQNQRADINQFQPTPTGFYSYHTPDDALIPYRLHLRVLPDNTGILIVNAASILRLNETGTYFAWLKMQGKTKDEISVEFLQRYQVDETSLKSDIQRFDQQILTIVSDPDQAPLITATGFNTVGADEQNAIPLRVNFCLTDRWGDDFVSSYKELSTEEWKTLIRKTFETGIPQVIFIGGEPTLRADLAELIQYTEELGMVSGLLTASARIYQDHSYLNSLLDGGLDHLIIEFDLEGGQDPKQLQLVFDQDLFTCIRFPVRRQSEIYTWVNDLVQAGANAISFYAADLNSHDRVAHLTQQLTTEDLVIEQGLPFPINLDNTEHRSELYSPEVTDHYPVYYTVFPDGTVANQNRTDHLLGNLLDSNWTDLINISKTQKEPL
ncbi:MAG: PqqD family peptide modification chaperone [Anaerolineaceae bacterium]